VAFYFAFRDTLVTDTIDHATQIAYSGKRWRVVTLEGDLIDISGTMSGGGTRKQRGGMTRSVAAVDPEKAKEELQGYQQEAEVITQNFHRKRVVHYKIQKKDWTPLKMRLNKPNQN